MFSVTRAIASRAAVLSHAPSNFPPFGVPQPGTTVPSTPVAPNDTINGMHQIQQYSTSPISADPCALSDQLFVFSPQQPNTQYVAVSQPSPDSIYPGLMLSPSLQPLTIAMPMSPKLHSQHHAYHTSAPYYLKSDDTITSTGAIAKRSVRRRKKDKNAPKRALTAYMIFSKETRPVVVSENPSLTFTEVGRLLGEKWRALSSDQKKPFEQKSEADKDRYRMEREKYIRMRKANFE